jgi:signal transduction histidine kinase
VNQFPDHIVVPAETSTVVYRIFQEVMNNVYKHSRATKVVIFVRKHPARFQLRIRDNGIGIDESARTGKRSFGILGMQERARMLHGSLTLEGEPGQGTTVLLEIPLEDLP